MKIHIYVFKQQAYADKNVVDFLKVPPTKATSAKNFRISLKHCSSASRQIIQFFSISKTVKIDLVLQFLS